MNSDSEADEAKPKAGAQAADEHPIGAAIDRFIHRARDTKLAARTYMPIAQRVKRELYEELGVQFKRIRPLLESDVAKTRILAQKEATLAVARFQRQQNSDVPGAVEVGLYLSLFAAYDAFTGDLLRALYKRKPSLFNSLKRTLSFEDVLGATTLDALKEQVLEEDIEAIRRTSYGEQFGTFTSRFGAPLTDFPSWAAFVERSQRRNLLTHCDGVVSEQYLSVCRSAGVADGALPELGDQIRLGPKYFFDSCELVLEVGLKLGHTLWRKTLPEELKLADSHLMSLLYGALEARQWQRARMIGAFAFEQKKLASDANRRTIIVNYVQALKRSGDGASAMKVLSSVDWSAAASEFTLADLVLRDKWDEAGQLMREIGPKHKLLNEHAYHVWPLFLEFRETEQFAAAYAALFGHSYTAKLEEEIQAASVGAELEAGRQAEQEAAVTEAIARGDRSDAGPDDGPEADDSAELPHPESAA